MKEQWEIKWKNYYKILQIDFSAEPEVIKAAYLKLAQKYNTNQEPTRPDHKWKDLNEAFEILGNPEKKISYDAAYSGKYHKSEESPVTPQPPQPKPERPPYSALATVIKLRPNDGAVLGYYQSGMDPVGICSDGTSVWVANKGRCDVTRLRCSDGANLGTFPLPATPNNIRSDGVHIWVISYEDIIKINPSNGAVLAEFKGFSSNSCICSDSQSIWVADGWGTIIKASVNDGAKLITYETGTENLINNISDICLDKDRTNIWVANFAANNVIKLQTSDGSVVVKHSAIWPTCLCFDGQNIWVSNMGSASVTKIRASDGIILGSYVVGDNPRYICSDGECIWVSNFNSGWLTKLNISDGTKLGMFKVGDSLSYICFDGSNIWVIDKQDTQ